MKELLFKFILFIFIYVFCINTHTLICMHAYTVDIYIYIYKGVEETDMEITEAKSRSLMKSNTVT